MLIGAYPLGEVEIGYLYYPYYLPPNLGGFNFNVSADNIIFCDEWNDVSSDNIIFCDEDFDVSADQRIYEQ